MNVKINGKQTTLDKPMSLLEFIKNSGLDKNKIVIEKNELIIDKSTLTETLIEENDTVEIVSFVGGG